MTEETWQREGLNDRGLAWSTELERTSSTMIMATRFETTGHKADEDMMLFEDETHSYCNWGELGIS